MSSTNDWRHGNATSFAVLHAKELSALEPSGGKTGRKNKKNKKHPTRQGIYVSFSDCRKSLVVVVVVVVEGT